MNRNRIDQYDTLDGSNKRGSRNSNDPESISLALKRMDLSVKKIGNLVDDRAKLNDSEQAKKNLRDLGQNTLPQLRGSAINSLGLTAQP